MSDAGADGTTSALHFFRNIPWCLGLIDDPSYQVTHAESRMPKASGEDALFAETFSTSRTIPHCLFLLRRPQGTTQRIEEVVMMTQLERKLNGHPEIAHGGVQSFLLDEAMAKLISVNKDLTSKPGDPRRPVTVTKTLDVEFVRAVTTPCPVVAVARWKVPMVDGSRKFAIASEIRDGHGRVLTRGEALFLSLREKEAKI